MIIDSYWLIYRGIYCRFVRFQVPLDICCVLPTYFEATRFLSRYCGALCFIFCQVIIKECPDIYSSFSSQYRVLELEPSYYVCQGVTCMSGHLREWRRDTGPGNIQPMILRMHCTRCMQVLKKIFVTFLIVCQFTPNILVSSCQ